MEWLAELQQGGGMNLLTALMPRRRCAPALSSPGYLVHADAPLIQFNRFGDGLRVRDAYEGIQVMGGTGSGKSSGSGRTIAMAMLRAGWGGMVLCAKPGEAQAWIEYAHAAGREADLLVMRPGSGLTHNFIDYEVHRPDGHGRETFNLVALMEIVADATTQALVQAAGAEEGAFWIASRREMLTNAIEPLVAATGRFRLEELMRFITSAPTSLEDARSDSWAETSFCYAILAKSHESPIGPRLPMHAVRAAADYWFSTYAALDAKTRSNIVVTLTAAISPFLRGTLHDTFCTDTTIIPELTHEGAILIVDYPIKTLGAAGVVAGQIMKYQWQKATERRAVEAYTRPTFLFADECQFFLSKYDAEFQSTARSSRAATVFLTQNLPTYYAQLPGRDPKSAAESLLGNFQTKIFHANTDAVTNQYASDLIGKALQQRASANWSANEGWQRGASESTSWNDQYGVNRGTQSGGSSSSGYSVGNGQSSSNGSYGSSWGSQRGISRSRSWGGGTSENEGFSVGATQGGGWSEQMDYTVPPVAFAAHLRKGGQSDTGLVDAVVVQGGRRFHATGSHWLHCTFQQ